MTSLVFAVCVSAGITSVAYAGTLGIGAGTGVGAGAGLGVAAPGAQVNAGIEVTATGNANAKGGAHTGGGKDLVSGTGRINEQSAMQADVIEKARATTGTARKSGKQEAAEATRAVAAGVQNQADVTQKAVGKVIPVLNLNGQASGSVKAGAQ